MKTSLAKRILCAVTTALLCVPLFTFGTSAAPSGSTRVTSDSHRVIYFDGLNMSTGSGEFYGYKGKSDLIYPISNVVHGKLSPATVLYGIKVQATNNHVMGFNMINSSGYGIAWSHYVSLRYKLVNVTGNYTIEIKNQGYNPQNDVESETLTASDGWKVYTAKVSDMEQISKTNATNNFLCDVNTFGIYFNGTFTEDSYVILDYFGRFDSVQAAEAEAQLQAPIWEAAQRTPGFVLAEDTYTEALDVEIACDDKTATVYYTTDGTDPTEAAGTLYTAPIHIEETTTIKTCSFVGGVASPITERTYTIVLTAKTPAFSLKSGKYDGEQTVTVTTATENARIYYTLDGTTPTSASNLYTEALKLNESCILKAIAVKDGFADSKVMSANYNITGTKASAETEAKKSAQETQPTAGEEKGGCGSVVDAGAMLLLVLAGAGAVVTKKKKI